MSISFLNKNKNDSSIGNGINYSTDEVKTNDVWIDGKPIYRKVINGNFPSSSAWTSFADFEGMDTMVKVYGYFIGTDGRKMTLPQTEQNHLVALSYQPSTNSIEIKQQGSDFYGRPCCIIIEYTKTID